MNCKIFFESERKLLLPVANLLFEKISENLSPGFYTANDLDRELQFLDFEAIQACRKYQDGNIIKVDELLDYSSIQSYDLIEIEYDGSRVRVPFYETFKTIDKLEKTLRIKPVNKFRWEVKSKSELFKAGEIIMPNESKIRKLSILIKKVFKSPIASFNLLNGTLSIKDTKSENSIVIKSELKLWEDDGIVGQLNGMSIDNLKYFHGRCIFQLYKDAKRDQEVQDESYLFLFQNQKGYKAAFD